MSVSCACTNGTQGAQVCTSDGDGYGSCMCSSGPGSAGTTGGAGTTGAGGATGSAGSVGTAGATGAAGSVAIGGTSGSAGTSGNAGTGGSSTGAAGRGGSGGATGSAGTTGAGGSGVAINCTGSNYNGRYVSVTFKDAIIGPGKTDHTSWDVGSAGGTLTIPNSVLSDLGTALASGNPAGGAIAVLAGPALNSAIDATAKPDAYGWVSGTAFGAMTDAFYLAESSEAIQDNYTPIWPRNGLTFQNAPIDCDVRFDVTLYDLDLINDDPIASVQINSNDLKDALAAQQKKYVRVDGQSAQQLLFLGITVVQQAGPLP
jgi:hypothetical protein